MRHILVIIAVLCFYSLGSQNVSFGARSEGLAHSTTVLSDAFSSVTNPAGLTDISNFNIALNVKNLYLINGLQSGSIVSVLPVKGGAFGVYVNTWGYDTYLNLHSGLSYGIRLADNFSLGASVYFQNTSFGNPYPSQKRLGANLGLRYQLTEKIMFGAFFSDVAGYGFNQPEVNVVENLFIGRIGVKYQFSEKVFSLLEMEKSVRYPTSFKFATEYRITDKIYLRGGISTNPQQFSFGVGFWPGAVKLDVSNNVHSALGHSPSISLGYASQTITND